MGFLTPLAFAFAALIPLVIALYLLKLKRTELVVSSTYLWQQMVEDIEANAPWQKLRINILLILQLLAIIALILSLARPFTLTDELRGSSVIMIIDRSASMSATDVNPSRLEVAKANAHELINTLPDNTNTTIMAVDEDVEILSAGTADRHQLHRAVDSIQINPKGSDLTRALELSAAIAARQPDTDVIIYSDGKVGLPQALTLDANVHFSPVGITGDNQAISLLTLSKSPQGEGITAFLQITNYSDEDANVRVLLHLDDALYEVYDITVPANAQQALLAERLPDTFNVLHAEITTDDPLGIDNHAWAVNRKAGDLNINLVSSGNFFLETALSLIPGIEFVLTSPEAYTQTTSTVEYDMTIFDTTSITSSLPAHNILFISPLASNPFFTVTGTIDTPVLTPAYTSDSLERFGTAQLVRHIDLESVNILKSSRVYAGGWANTLYTAKDTNDPMFLAGELNSQRIAVLAFDLHDSDLPLNVSFPILLTNLIQWLAPADKIGMPLSVTPGEAIVLPPSLDAGSYNLTSPNGHRTTIENIAPPIIFAETDQLGVYMVENPNGEQASFTVNLFSPAESDIEPVSSLPITSADAAGINGQEQARREWWRTLAILVLTLFIIEWLIYNKNGVKRIRRWINSQYITQRTSGGES